MTMFDATLETSMTAFPTASRSELSLLPLELRIEPAPRAEAAQTACEPLRDDDPGAPIASGCGWFDSSFELRQGLQVVELALPERWPFDPPPWECH